MATPAYRLCSKCGSPLPSDNSVECHEDEGVLFVRYDPSDTKIVLVNTESGVKHTVDLSTQKRTPKAVSRQMGGIIGPY